MTNSFEDIAVLPREKSETRNEREEKSRHVPRYNIVLWDDDDHTYDYVIAMLSALFGYAREKGFRIADTVSKTGHAILLTTTKEYAELKQEQIHAFGPDKYISECAGSMTATIEPADSE